MKLISSRFRPSALLISAVAAGGVLVGAALAQPDPGKPPGTTPASETFIFQVCNKTTDIPTIFVATVQIASHSPQQFRAHGWTRIAQGECIEGPALRPRIWIHARAGDTMWTKGIGNIVPICVILNAGFDYTWDGRSRQCQQGELHADFVSQEIPPNQNLRNLDLI